MLGACGGNARTRRSSEVVRPSFSADSAYRYIQAQLDFGPRVPETEAHDSCVAWLTEMFSRFGAEVTVEEGVTKDYAGENLRVRNIIAHIAADSSQKTILLCAHYDSRPWCDEDEEAAWYQPVPAANDGASGVAVLLEVARQLQQKKANGERLKACVDIVLFDCEDLGTPRFLDELDAGMFRNVVALYGRWREADKAIREEREAFAQKNIVRRGLILLGRAIRRMVKQGGQG